MTDRVHGKVAFITGAARGQGRSHAVRLAEEGADIIAIDVCGPLPQVPYPLPTPADLEETARLVESFGRRVTTRSVDVRDLDGLRSAVDEGVAALGKLDIVIANAGIMLFQKWNEVTPERWQDVIDINLTGVWNTCHVSAQHLIDNGGGSMILVSSVAGLKGLPFFLPYTAAKHGVVGLIRGYAYELADHNVRVNTVHPTGVNTGMEPGEFVNTFGELLATKERMRAMFTNALPVELIEPRDVSNAVLFLASDESRYVTGHTMLIDAGTVGY